MYLYDAETLPLSYFVPKFYYKTSIHAGLDELDEFNEAPHIVHGDVLLPPSLLAATEIEQSANQHYDIINNGDINVSLLDDDEEDVVLSTDDLLLGNNNNFLSSTNHHNNSSGVNLLHLNNSSSSDIILNTNKNVIA